MMPMQMQEGAAPPMEGGPQPKMGFEQLVQAVAAYIWQMMQSGQLPEEMMPMEGEGMPPQQPGAGLSNEAIQFAGGMNGPTR